jgi:DNA-binding NarL/FixJ family response regulator
MDPTTVLIADARVLVRNGLRALVSSLLEEVRFVEVEEGDSLLRIAGDERIRFAIIDPNMPRLEDGRRLVELARRCPRLPLVIVSAFTSPGVVRRMADIATISAFVPVSASLEAIRRALQAAMEGRKISLTEFGESSVTRDVVSLTPRQQEIRRLLGTGMSNKSIAGALGISESTVKNHITEIFKALKATNRTQAARINAPID